MDPNAWLEEIRSQFRRHKDQCERATAQVSDDQFFLPLAGNPQSIATLVKHLGGNHRSRWRDFLTTDGEKPDRHRDTEFQVEGQTRAEIEAIWDEGWSFTLGTLDSLTDDDIDRTITIRGEPHTVVQALQRGVTHLAYHTGQIVQLARAHAGEDWQTLSVALGKVRRAQRRYAGEVRRLVRQREIVQGARLGCRPPASPDVHSAGPRLDGRVPDRAWSVAVDVPRPAGRGAAAGREPSA